MLKIFVAVTDKDWFDFLSGSQPDEVNFWAPSGRTNFRALRPGELFLFKLHAPLNFIVGGGIFSISSRIPLSLAWETFGTKNGVRSHVDMHERIRRYRSDESFDPRIDPVIGCRILTKPFFWPRDLWLPIPPSWKPNIVVGRGFDTEEVEGRALWNPVLSRAESSIFTADSEQPARYGTPTLVKPRLGQGAFRIIVTDAYERRCAVTGERTLPILDAAHIRSYADGGMHEASNGVLLRTDVHKLFDLGYVTIDEKRQFVVSRRLKEDFDNGRHYYDLHGSTLRDPRGPTALPSPAALQWHRENRFLG
ncbi:HNH endonuclease [Mesorhizobium sp. M4A.F.Ca.ET.050.02.1.1]|uniref:HNH endonuclease n=1 Tax=Mesorhizobium sp. M4A.F.Ca.ET.050.02.1.1 TaxID=2496754 RepID=UPI000FC9A971|nr:HNH endonuclease [Mesorhizobium sp. M4A.F.Ca.ET.050.02.1.1]RUX50461.1 HNH endonuclease [Mesorhizobium sp. M4A.F.Ca.ET.050.02.1.1]